MEKEHKSPVDKRLLRPTVLVSLGRNDTGQSCLGKILSTKLSFSLYLATYLHLPVQTQPASSLWSLIAHGHDLGHWEGDRPVPE